MCGKGVMMVGHWTETCTESHSSSNGGGGSSRFSIKGKEGVKEEAKRSESHVEEQQRKWHKCAKSHGGRHHHRFRRRGHYNYHHQQQHIHRRVQSRHRHRLSSMSLRPANVKGNRAPGMRAPRNTNQFLMHEKYQLMHMRSDSVGTDSGSDCELDCFTDMDAYLGVLENARGALMDSPDFPSPPTARFTARPGTASLGVECRGIAIFSFAQADQEESMQYFPSEDDVLQSEDFMRKDFNAFCAAVEPCL